MKPEVGVCVCVRWRLAGVPLLPLRPPPPASLQSSRQQPCRTTQWLNALPASLALALPQENQALQAKQRELQAALAHAEKAARAALGQQEKLESLQVMILCSVAGIDGCVEQARQQVALGQREKLESLQVQTFGTFGFPGCAFALRWLLGGPALGQLLRRTSILCRTQPQLAFPCRCLARCAGRAAPGAGCCSGRRRAT